MGSYHIVGGHKMYGDITVQGAKNAALPIVIASLLVDGKIALNDFPDIADTKVAIHMLTALGSKVQIVGNSAYIDNENLHYSTFDIELTKKMRSSIMFLGAMLGRFGECVIHYPGGCKLGARPIDLHLEGLKKLGVKIVEEDDCIIASVDKLLGNVIDLSYPSVGATENIIMCAVYAEGETIINNPAREPEIVDLQNFLNEMGAKIRGAGTKKIIIKGVKKLQGNSYKIMPDRIVAGTYMTATAMVGGEVNLYNVNHNNIINIIFNLRKAGAKVKIYDDNSIVTIKSDKRLNSVNNITTNPYPSFPTDMQSQFATMLSIARGQSKIIENIFENRYKHINELNKMGANIVLENDTTIINGVQSLKGTKVEAMDLRGGASLVMAGLFADGNTVVKNSYHILRGYENLDSNLRKLGCKIKHMEDI